MFDMPLLPGENTSGWSSLPPRAPPGPAMGPSEDPFRVQAGFGAARNRKLSTDPNFSVLVRVAERRAPGPLRAALCCCPAAPSADLFRVARSPAHSGGRSPRRMQTCRPRRWALCGRWSPTTASGGARTPPSRSSSPQVHTQSALRVIYGPFSERLLVIQDRATLTPSAFPVRAHAICRCL